MRAFYNNSTGDRSNTKLLMRLQPKYNLTPLDKYCCFYNSQRNYLTSKSMQLTTFFASRHHGGYPRLVSPEHVTRNWHIPRVPDRYQSISFPTRFLKTTWFYTGVTGCNRKEPFLGSMLRKSIYNNRSTPRRLLSTRMIIGQAFNPFVPAADKSSLLILAKSYGWKHNKGNVGVEIVFRTLPPTLLQKVCEIILNLNVMVKSIISPDDNF